jgi:nucleoside 2-deoxyribosyltransferase
LAKSNPVLDQGGNMMSKGKAVNSTQEAIHAAGPYTVYVASGLFNQYELAMNVSIKEAVSRLSGGRFQLFLPQSRELRDLDRPDVKAYIRNDDLVHVLRADILLARFDGLDLDSGIVVEYMAAKALGKPTVIWRSDFRRQSATSLSEPYNLMVENWPRTLEIRMDAFVMYMSLLAQERKVLGESEPFQDTMKAELGTVQKSVDEVARKLIDGLEAVLKMESPYAPEVQETVYRIFRHSPGSGFDQMLTEEELDEIIQRLRRNGTL